MITGILRVRGGTIYSSGWVVVVGLGVGLPVGAGFGFRASGFLCGFVRWLGFGCVL